MGNETKLKATRVTGAEYLSEAEQEEIGMKRGLVVVETRTETGEKK